MKSGARRLGRIATVLLGSLLLLISGVLTTLFFLGEIGGPILYRLRGDYRGWIGIRYDDPACAPLRRPGWYLVIPTADGRGCTSSPVPDGWRYVRYEYINADGTLRELSREEVRIIAITGPQKPRVETMFVGSKEELERSWPRRLEVEREMKGASSK